MQEQQPIRVYWPDGPEPSRPPAAGKLSADMSLSEFFWQYAWPDCLAPKGDTLATRKDYLKSLDYWGRLSGDPPLGQITKRTCSKFVRLLNGLRGNDGEPVLSPNTIYKHWSNVQRLIQWSGPAGRQNPNGTNLVAQPAWIETPRKEHVAPKRGFRLDEIWQWLQVLPEAAKAMPKMGGCDPIAWWAGLIVCDYNTGMRPATLFGIRWEMIDGHLLRGPTSIIKGHHGRLLWLNDAALEAIEPLRRPSGLVFRWENWPEADSTLRKHRERTQRAAGIRPLSLYGLRRAFSTQCAKINPLAAQIMMGHQGFGMEMMINHYLDLESVLSDALAKLPQPGAARQKQLF